MNVLEIGVLKFIWSGFLEICVGSCYTSGFNDEVDFDIIIMSLYIYCYTIAFANT